VAIARGNEKGRVERAIRYVRESFFAARQWRDLDELNAQAEAWCQGQAAERGDNLGSSTAALLRLLERNGAAELEAAIGEDEIAAAPWLEPLIGWEEQERARRALERRLANARLGRFKPLADFDWNWPAQCDRHSIEELMRLGFLKEAANAVLVGPNGVGKNPPSPATSPMRPSC